MPSCRLSNVRNWLSCNALAGELHIDDVWAAETDGVDIDLTNPGGKRICFARLRKRQADDKAA